MSQFSTRPRMDGLVALLERYVALCSKVPHSLLALLGRFALAALFWKAGQTKVANFALDPFAGTWQIGWPRLADFAVELFASEYQLPFIAPAVAALLAATAEHVLALLLLLGLATRFAALGLLGMTLVIQLLVYPDAYPTHATWAAVLLYLLARGPGVFSLDHLLARHYCVLGR